MDFYMISSEGRCIPSRSIFSQLKIGFDFLFKYYTPIHLDQHSSTTWFTAESPYAREPSFCSVIVDDDELSYDDIREAVEGAIGHRLPDPQRDELIEWVCEEVSERFPTDETLADYELFTLTFDVGIRYRYAEVDDEGEMVVPAAAESSFAVLEVLEECEVGDDDDDCCCICLEELLGGGAPLARTPCSHVFHEGCVVKWLTMSHCCPLCRYQMPTE